MSSPSMSKLHHDILNEVLDACTPGAESRSDSTPIEQVIAAVVELIDAKVACDGPYGTIPDYVLKRFCLKSGWAQDAAGEPTAARNLFGAYVRAGFIRLSEPVNQESMPTWMSRRACPLEFGISMGLPAGDAIRCLIAEGANIDTMVARKPDASIEAFILRVAPVTEATAIQAAVAHAMMTLRLQAPLPVDPAPAPRRARHTV